MKRFARSCASWATLRASASPSSTGGRRGGTTGFRRSASELVGLKVDVIVTTGTPGALAAMQATKTIPIVMASSADPVGSGLVKSLARPQGNVTGFTILGPQLEGKRLELLMQAVPGLSRLAVLWNPSNPGIVSYFETVKTAGQALRISLDPVMEVRQADEFDNAFAVIANARPMRSP